MAVPTVVVHGDEDDTSPLEATGRPTAAAIAGARLVVVEGASHGLPLTRPAELEAAILDLVGVPA